jgi:hypothetical protein
VHHKQAPHFHLVLSAIAVTVAWRFFIVWTLLAFSELGEVKDSVCLWYIIEGVVHHCS